MSRASSPALASCLSAAEDLALIFTRGRKHLSKQDLTDEDREAILARQARLKAALLEETAILAEIDMADVDQESLAETASELIATFDPEICAFLKTQKSIRVEWPSSRIIATLRNAPEDWLFAMEHGLSYDPLQSSHAFVIRETLRTFVPHLAGPISSRLLEKVSDICSTKKHIRTVIEWYAVEEFSNAQVLTDRIAVVLRDKIEADPEMGSELLEGYLQGAARCEQRAPYCALVMLLAGACPQASSILSPEISAQHGRLRLISAFGSLEQLLHDHTLNSLPPGWRTALVGQA